MTSLGVAASPDLCADVPTLLFVHFLLLPYFFCRRFFFFLFFLLRVGSKGRNCRVCWCCLHVLLVSDEKTVKEKSCNRRVHRTTNVALYNNRLRP
jgi:hypothetical protein